MCSKQHDQLVGYDEEHTMHQSSAQRQHHRTQSRYNLQTEWNPAGRAENTGVAQSRQAVRTVLYFQMREGELYYDMTVVRTKE